MILGLALLTALAALAAARAPVLQAIPVRAQRRRR